MATVSMISSERVEELFKECLTGNGDVIVYGVHNSFGLDRNVLEAHREEIVAMLMLLPDNFKVGKGGGWSLLMAHEDKNGVQWTSFHERCEQLFLLGMGIDAVKYSMPREFWNLLPGGVPMYTITF